MKRALLLGALLGVAYTLSPLTVIGCGALAVVVLRAARDLSPRERQWFLGAMTLALALRLAAIAGLFLFADPARPYANFFGDEELFKSETVWLRNVGYGVSMSPADVIYVFDEVGRSSYVYVLAYIQALAGDAPYGNNVLNVAVYLTAIAISYRYMRGIYGRVTALAGAVILLFVPSLFSWSISVLKEPSYILVAALELICAAEIVRAPTLPRRILALIGVLSLAAILGSLRSGGTELAIAGTAVGVTAGLIVTRPRLAWASLVVLPLAIGVAMVQPTVQQRLSKALGDTAFLHWGHVATPGLSYKLLDTRFYVGDDRTAVYTMNAAEMARYTIRAAAAFASAPRPWEIESRSALAYLPEQAFWYVVLALTPFGVIAGLSRAPVVTCVLLSHGLVASAMVALTSGNIGTLIRHRGLTLPYFTWLAAFGAFRLIEWWASRASRQSLFLTPGSIHDAR